MKKKTLIAGLLFVVYGASAQTTMLTIDEMFRLADENSKLLIPHGTAVVEAEQAAKVARNARLPDVSIGASVGYLGHGTILDRDFSNPMKAAMPHFGNSLSVEASQVVYTGGAINAGIRLAQLAAKQARLSEKINCQGVRMMLVGQYLDLYKMHNMRRVYEQNIALTKQVIEDLSNRYASGVVLKNDITRYELQLSNLQLAATQTDNAISVLNRNLTTYLGIEGSVICPDSSLLHVDLPAASAAEWTDRALVASASIGQLSTDVDMKREERKIAHAEFVPDIAIVASNTLEGPITIELPAIDKNFNYWFVGVGLKYDLSSLYKARKSVRHKELAVKRANEELDNAREQTVLQAYEAYTKYRESLVERDTQLKNVELARANYNVTSSRYDEGMALVTDMIDASNALLTAQLQLENARINILFSYYKLKYIANEL